MAITYLQSPAEDGGEVGVRVFLAGGAKAEWRGSFARLLAAREAPWILYDPINHDWHEHALERRIDWEVRHFERADVVAAWLPAAPAHDLVAQSPTTCFELGQLALIKPLLRVGIAAGHPARDRLVARLSRHSVPVVESLEELAAAIPSQAPGQRLRAPPRTDEERHFYVGAEPALEELFDLGMAVRSGRVQVTIADGCPLARELRAQLARLSPHK
jgi:hypothetical protein